MTIICLFWYTQDEDILRQVIQLFQTGCFWINFRKLVCHPKQFELKHHQNSYQEHYLCWSIIKRGLVLLSSLWAVLILEDNFWLQKIRLSNLVGDVCLHKYIFPSYIFIISKFQLLISTLSYQYTILLHKFFHDLPWWKFGIPVQHS